MKKIALIAATMLALVSMPRIAEAAEECPVDFKTATPEQAKAAVEAYMKEEGASE